MVNGLLMDSGDPTENGLPPLTTPLLLRVQLILMRATMEPRPLDGDIQMRPTTMKLKAMALMLVIAIMMLKVMVNQIKVNMMLEYMEMELPQLTLVEMMKLMILIQMMKTGEMEPGTPPKINGMPPKVNGMQPLTLVLMLPMTPIPGVTMK